MKNFLIVFLYLITFGVNAQLNGTAFLQSQTNHSGIRVKFIAQGGTAVTDSSYTSASGNYSINITPGVYSIAFAKPGYVDGFYNDGASVLLTNTTVLSGITLNPGNPVFVNGVVSGTWLGTNVYVVLGDLTVASGSTLSIMPGTKVQFNGYFSINGNGVIKATGSNSNPILFTSGKQNKARNDWKQISLNSTGSNFDNCIFEYSSFAINFQSGSANVSNNIFRHGGTLAAYLGTGTPLIENNEIYDLDDAQGVIGIWVEGSATGTINCNYLHDLNSAGYNSYGIIHNSSLVKDNHISNITGPSPIGIQTRYSGSRNINNCISNSGMAIHIDGNWTTSNQLIANNILYGNKSGIIISYGSYPTNPTIVNNLITDNEYGIVQGGTTNGTITIDHNLLWNQSSANYSNVQIAGIGQIVSTNSSGYPIDSYFNMYQDPLYNGTAPFLSTTSPCYGTGNTAYSSQIGFNNPQGCSGSVLSVRNLSNSIKLSVFPNPCSGTFTLSSDTGDKMIITIYDMSGRIVHSATATSGEQVNAHQLANGIYVIIVKKGNTKGRTLLNILK